MKRLFCFLLAALAITPVLGEELDDYCKRQEPTRPGTVGRLCVQVDIVDGGPVIRAQEFVPAADRTPRDPNDIAAALRRNFEGVTPQCVEGAGGKDCLVTVPPTQQVCAQDARSAKNTAPDLTSWEAYWARLMERCEVDFSQLGPAAAALAGVERDSPFELSETVEPSGRGAFAFDVHALPEKIEDLSIRVFGILPQGEREKALRRALAPLAGALWSRTAIEERLHAYYGRVGLRSIQPKVRLKPPNVVVFEGMPLRLVKLPEPPSLRLKSAWLLLEDHDFRVWAAQPAPPATIVYTQDPLSRREGEEPVVVQERVDRATQRLAAAGLSLEAQPAGQRPVSIDEHLQDMQQFVVTDSATQSEAAPKRRFVGAEITHRPGQGTSVRGVFRHNDLRTPIGTAAFGIKAGKEGGDQESAEVDALLDYIAFDTLRMRLSAQVSAVSEPEPNRFLGGVFLDETRKGTRGRVELEPFRDRNGHGLLFFVQAEQLELGAQAPGGGVQATQDLHTLRLGADWRIDRFERLRPWALRLQAEALAGSVEGGPDYHKARLGGVWHQRLANLVLESSLLLEAASAATPLQELPSLGGQESVRGFRRDDGLGRRAWKLQNELWTPLPGVKPDSTLGKYLNNVRLAGFVDVGAVHQPAPGSTAGTRVGYGFGLRYIASSLVARLDIAHGDGPADTGRKPVRVYFGIGADFPL